MFFNKNKMRNSFGIIDTPNGTEGIGVLYSTDGIKFYEYDSSNVLKIEDIPNKLWPHVFKSSGQWTMAYSDVNDAVWNQNFMRKTKYITFNWKTLSDFDPR